MTGALLSLVIPRRMPTVNVWHGGPAWKFSKERDAWLVAIGWLPEVRWFAARQRQGARPCSVQIVRLMEPGERRYDEDNLRGGAKPILDVLKRCGVLKSDTPKWCTQIPPEQRLATDGERLPGTLITVSLL